jgi:hypothetical protein
MKRTRFSEVTCSPSLDRPGPEFPGFQAQRADADDEPFITLKVVKGILLCFCTVYMHEKGTGLTCRDLCRDLTELSCLIFPDLA